MNPPPFIIVADRGQLKAFHVEGNNRGGFTPRLIALQKYYEPAQRYAEKFTDRAGAFPNGGTAGHGNAIAERMPLAAEEEMRAFRRLASEIEDLLRSHHPSHWAFAAPSEINGAILDGLPPHLHERLAINLPRDLVNIDATELLEHFEKTRA